MATRPSYFRERARNPYLKARPPAPGLEQDPNASPLAPADFLATPPRRAVAPQSTPTFDPNQAVMATMPALLPEGAVARAAPPDVGSLAFLPPPDEAAGAGASAPRNVTRAVAPPVVDPLDAPRAAFMAGTPTTTKGRILQALANAGLGALQAAGRDRENPLGAALGGAIAGGGISAVNPRYGRAYQFEQFKRPEIEAREAREQELLRRRRAEEDRALNEEYRRAQTRALDRSNLPQPRQTTYASSPLGIFNTSTGEVVRPAPPKEEREPTALQATLNPETGLSVEEEAEASYQGRGGDDYVRSKLPARTRQILEAGTVVAGGKTRSANATERDAAQREFERAIERQRKIDKEYTTGATRAKRLGGRQGATQPRSGITRSRSEFNSKKFPGLKFD